MPDSWITRLKAYPIEWLLEEDNPSVRLTALVDLQGKSSDAPKTLSVKRRIMKTGPVPRILEGQEPGGFWGTERGFYTEKYTGTVWRLLVLAELGADGSTPAIRKACEFILGASQDPQSGGFSLNTSGKAGGGRHSEVIPCLTANLVWSLLKFGCHGDPRVMAGIDWLIRYQRYDDGEGTAPAGWPYDKYEICWGRHTCHMGVAKALKAIAEIPPEDRTAAMRDLIGRATEFLLMHHIHKRSHEPSVVAKPGWLRFGFPLMYQTDALEILDVLTRLGCRDTRMRDAVNALAAKQGTDGMWKLENSYNDRLPVPIEEKGKPSKWITLKALTVLKQYYS